ncbi:MAG: DUF1501 domain-containing protein [Planctomycetota bacterium]|nr:DUF1501 domain-containing protein [Planctomycetota bacterium]
MNDQQTTTYSRRLFMQQGLTFASLTATAPLFLQRSAMGMLAPAGSMLSSQPGVPEDRVLVVVQLGGGNDGLNTVVPYGMNAYHKARPNIAIPAPGRGTNDRPAALDLGGLADGLGLHPAFAGFKDLLDDGVASIVQGVGYPNPNRSHFTSMDIWHTADTDGINHGWIGRYFDNTCQGKPIPEGAVSIGRESPLAMNGEIQKPISFESADLFQWLGESMNDSIDTSYQKINRAGVLDNVDPDGQLGFLMRTALDAQVSSERIRKAVAKKPLVRYPQGELARQLRIVSAMIRDELKTRVYYVTLSGFDTHAGQAGQHANLLRQVGGALKSFHTDLRKQGNSSRVLTMVFSEFGRRVAQNASAGTDHGTAAPMFFVGDMIRPGVLGDHPSLADLEQGDLRFKVDFRSLYAAVLEDWLGADSRSVLGSEFRKARIIKA